MAGREEFRADFVVGKNEITEEAEKAAKALEKLEGESAKVELDADVSGVLAAFDQVAAEAKQTATAAEALGRALGPELAAKADAGAVVGELKSMGLTLDQITGNADQLGAKMRELADADVGGKLGSSLGTTRGKLDEVAQSANSSRSVLANMVGNATQDLGALGGVAGSAGVAIGQMGEYMADAAGSGDKFGTIIKNFAGVAGPIAAIGLGVQLISSYMASIAATDAFNKEQVQGFADALADANVSAEELVGVLAQGEDAGFMARIFSDTKDVIPQLLKTGSTFADVQKIVNDGAPAFDAWVSGQLATAAAGGATSGQLANLSKALTGVRDDQRSGSAEAFAYGDGFGHIITSGIALGQVLHNTAKGTETAAQRQEFYGDASEAAREADEKATAAKEEATQAALEHAQAVAEATKAWQDYVSTVKSVDWQEADIIGATDAMAGYSDQMFGLTRINADYQEAVDGFTQSLKDNGDTFDLNSEKGRANQQALEGIASALDTRLVAAYGDANGSLTDFQAISEAAFQQLVADLGLGAEGAERLRDQLNLTPAEVETRFKLSQEAEALQKLQLLQGAISALPTDVQLQIGAQIAAGDIVGAAQTATTAMNEAVAAGPPATFPTAADTSGAVADVGAFTGGAQPAATVQVEADPAPAEATTEKYRTRDRNTTPVKVLADDAIAAAVLLALITRRRETIIAVGTSGVPGVESTLNQVSRDRDTVVHVGTSGVGAADAALDALTRARQVTITPRVVPTSVLVRVDGGG